MRKYILTVFILLVGVFASLPASAAGNAGGIPIQHHGRIKPFAAFAQETLQMVSGKNSWHGQAAADFILANLDNQKIFLELPLIRVDHPELKKLLNLTAEGTAFTYEQLKPSFQILGTLIQASGEKREKDNRPSALEQQAELVYQRIVTVQHLSTGEMITVMPAKDGVWTSPFMINRPEADEFKLLAKNFAAKSPAAAAEISAWIAKVEALLVDGQSTKLNMEAAYYSLQPFYYAWILYLLGFVFLLAGVPLINTAGRYLVLAGFVFHTGGILLRWLILARPPVANMYETMVFMDWVLVFTVGIFVVIKKQKAFLSSGALVSALVMLYARLLPVDQSLDVLSPVLRSSYWLTIHVITIISSYSLFAFAMAVAHRHLFLSVFGKMTPQEDQVSGHTIDRLLQAGQIALGAGTILGGVWANEAWGRFWGWDPKETWAFITFLGYMTVLHLRYSKKLDNFALAVGSILGFLLVVMTWYGVNFVLGRGMHSYGSGSGGLQWIVFFLIFEVCFLGFVLSRKKR